MYVMLRVRKAGASMKSMKTICITGERIPVFYEARELQITHDLYMSDQRLIVSALMTYIQNVKNGREVVAYDASEYGLPEVQK